MILTKTFAVLGEVIGRNGQRIRTIGEKVDKVVNDFTATLDPDSVIDVKTSADFGGASGDAALVTILYKADKPKKSKK